MLLTVPAEPAGSQASALSTAKTKCCEEQAKDLQGQFYDSVLALERTPDFSRIEFCSFDIRNWAFVLNSRQALNSGYFFLNLPNAGTAGMCLHIQLNRDF